MEPKYWWCVKLRILLIQPASNIMKNRKESKPALEPVGLTYIAGTLLNAGYTDVEILDVMAEGYYHETSFKEDYIRYGLSPEDIKQRIREFAPDIIGVSCIVSLRKYHTLEVCELAKQVDERIVTVVGGNPVTCFPEDYLRYDYVDYVVLGEGEQPFLELVRYYDNTRVDLNFDGIGYKMDEAYILRPQSYWEKDLNKIPFPAHHLVPLDKYLEIWRHEGYHYYEAKKFIMTVMARGCPNLCEHCPHNVIFPGYRIRSGQNIFDEVKKAYEELCIEEVQFHEYNGMVSWPIVRDFCNLMIQSGLNKKIVWGWPIGIWVKVLTYDRLKLMREAGMAYVDLAIESANQQMLNDLMKGKGVDLKYALDVIEWCRELDYYINCFFMIGLEGQTKQDIEETTDFAKTLDVDTVTFFIAQPLPGTQFWEHCRKQNLFLDGFDTFHLRYGKSNIKVTDVTPEELEHYRELGRKTFLDYWKRQGRIPHIGVRGNNYLLKKSERMYQPDMTHMEVSLCSQPTSC